MRTAATASILLASSLSAHAEGAQTDRLVCFNEAEIVASGNAQPTLASEVERLAALLKRGVPLNLDKGAATFGNEPLGLSTLTVLADFDNYVIMHSEWMLFPPDQDCLRERETMMPVCSDAWPFILNSDCVNAEEAPREMPACDGPILPLSAEALNKAEGSSGTVHLYWKHAILDRKTLSLEVQSWQGSTRELFVERYSCMR